jgi:hypothetical protein
MGPVQGRPIACCRRRLSESLSHPQTANRNGSQCVRGTRTGRCRQDKPHTDGLGGQQLSKNQLQPKSVTRTSGLIGRPLNQCSRTQFLAEKQNHGLYPYASKLDFVHW